MGTSRSRVAIALLAGGVVAATPASAAATIRYVVQGGMTTGTCTTVPTACNPATVINSANGANATAQPGDTVIVLGSGGPIDVSGDVLAPTEPLIIEGDPSVATRPVIESVEAETTTLSVSQAGTRISHLDLRNLNTVHGVALSASGAVTVDDVALTADYTAAVLGGGATVSGAAVSMTSNTAGALPAVMLDGASSFTHSTVSATGTAGSGVEATNGASVTDDVITSSQTGVEPSGSSIVRRVSVTAGTTALNAGGATVTDSVLVSATGPAVTAEGSTLTLRNVTAISDEATGLEAQPSLGGAGPGLIDARNVIARSGGTALDVTADPAGFTCLIPPCHPGAVAIGWSNFQSASTSGVTDVGPIQSADPQFADPFNGDYHPRSTSPAIDAGIADAADGPTDLDGHARNQGLAPDIGAYESTPPTIAPPGQGPGSGDTPPPTNQPPPPDTTAPTITGASLSHATFAVAPASTAATAKTRPPLGTTIRFTLSEAAGVRLTFARATSGRRSGTSCVKPIRALRHAKACTRYVSSSSLPSLTRSEKQRGAQSVAFTGRVRGRAFAIGGYQLTLVASDAAGNSSAAKRLTFRVVAR